MHFIDKYIFVDERFSVGIEQTTGKYYLSIPVANPYADYEEYYELTPETFRACPENFRELKIIAERSRMRQNDSRLIVQPGSMRGSPL
jgi:hypothetical protein